MSNARRRGDPAASEFRLEASPFYWMNRTSGRYGLEMEKSLKRIGMDMAGWRTLMILSERSPRSVSEIAEQAALRLSTTTRVVQRLAASRLVRTMPRPGDARSTDVHLSAAGRRRLTAVRRAASAVYVAAMQGVAAADILQLNALLARVFGNLAARRR